MIDGFDLFANIFGTKEDEPMQRSANARNFTFMGKLHDDRVFMEEPKRQPVLKRMFSGIADLLRVGMWV